MANARIRQLVSLPSLVALAASGAALAGASPASAEGPCTRFAAPGGSDSAAGSETAPYRTAQRLADSLGAGETGCLREGTYGENVSIRKGGSAGAPVTLRSFPGERAEVVGIFYVARTAPHVTVEGLYLNGRNPEGQPSPQVNAADTVFRGNDVTNDHTGICFILGEHQYGRAIRTLIEHNRIHDCGRLPSTNLDHGIYVARVGRRSDNEQLDLRQRRLGRPPLPRRAAHRGRGQRHRGQRQGRHLRRRGRPRLQRQPRPGQRDLGLEAALQHRLVVGGWQPRSGAQRRQPQLPRSEQAGRPRQRRHRPQPRVHARPAIPWSASRATPTPDSATCGSSRAAPATASTAGTTRCPDRTARRQRLCRPPARPPPSTASRLATRPGRSALRSRCPAPDAVRSAAASAPGSGDASSARACARGFA